MAAFLYKIKKYIAHCKKLFTSEIMIINFNPVENKYTLDFNTRWVLKVPKINEKNDPKIPSAELKLNTATIFKSYIFHLDFVGKSYFPWTELFNCTK